MSQPSHRQTRPSLLKRKHCSSDSEDTENRPPSEQRERLDDEERLLDLFIEDQVEEVCSSPPSGLSLVDLDSTTTDPITHTTQTWGELYGATCLLTPVSERFSPLPVLNWADPREVWDLMCHKDDVSMSQRDDDLFSKHPCLQARMRAILLDWLMEVCEVYQLHRETYHLTIDFIDRYLSNQEDIPKQQLQLIGITCLFIAAKVEEIYPPKIAEFAYVTDGACTDCEILDKELVILKALKWNLSPVTVNSWMNTYMQLGFGCRPRQDHSEMQDGTFVFPQYSGLAFIQTAQLVDLCMLDEGSLRFPYSVIAASALYHMYNRERALYVSGLQWTDVASCAQWMSPFAWVVREEAPSQVVAAVRQGSATSDSGSCGLSKLVPHLVVDDSHNIQTHSVDLHMLEKALEHANQTTVPDNSPEAKGCLLTPPSSHKKATDRQIAVGGSVA